MAVLALAAVLLAAPASAAAAETAPLVPKAQAEQQTVERIKSFGRDRGYKGVSASDKRLRQARVGGMMLNLRVFTPMGGEVTFREKLGAASASKEDICLTMQAMSDESCIMLQMDQKALDTLTRVGVTEIVVADRSGYVRMRYSVADLAGVRTALGLAAEEQLAVSGENDPITVVSEDGVRRQLTH